MKALFLFSFFLAGISSVAATADQALVIRYYYDGKTRTQTPVVLQWTSQDQCTASLPNRKDELLVESKTCKSIYDETFSNWAELEKKSKLKLSAQKRSRTQSHHAHYADLDVNDLSFGIIRTSEKRCDENHEHCVAASSAKTDQLGFKIMNLVGGLK